MEKIKTKQKKIKLVDWITMSDDDVFSIFAGLDDVAIPDTEWNKFIYRKGRNKRVILKTHISCFSPNVKKSSVISSSENTIYSEEPSKGICATGRTGCSILWNMLHLDPSIIVSMNRNGHSFFSIDYKYQEIFEEIYEHDICLDFDRPGWDEIILHKKDGEQEDVFGKLRDFYNSFAISYGVKYDKINYARIPTGIGSANTENETVFLDDWCRTLNLTKQLVKTNAV